MPRASKPAVTEREYARAAELREALRLFQRRTEEVTHAHGLTPRTYQLLLMLKTARNGDGRATRKSTVTELVLRTEKRGLVRRELDRERARGISVVVTPTGARRLAAAVADLGDERKRLFDILGRLA